MSDSSGFDSDSDGVVAPPMPVAPLLATVVPLGTALIDSSSDDDWEADEVEKEAKRKEAAKLEEAKRAQLLEKNRRVEEEKERNEQMALLQPLSDPVAERQRLRKLQEVNDNQEAAELFVDFLVVDKSEVPQTSASQAGAVSGSTSAKAEGAKAEGAKEGKSKAATSSGKQQAREPAVPAAAEEVASKRRQYDAADRFGKYRISDATALTTFASQVVSKLQTADVTDETTQKVSKAIGSGVIRQLLQKMCRLLVERLSETEPPQQCALSRCELKGLNESVKILKAATSARLLENAQKQASTKQATNVNKHTKHNVEAEMDDVFGGGEGEWDDEWDEEWGGDWA